MSEQTGVTKCMYCARPNVESAPAVVVTDDTFRCIRDLTPVRNFFVSNVLGDVDATVAVAQSPTGGTYPPGSLLQVIPTTAMVKHQPGHNPATNDWEFFELEVNAQGAKILGRGFEDLNMRSGASGAPLRLRSTPGAPLSHQLSVSHSRPSGHRRKRSTPSTSALK